MKQATILKNGVMTHRGQFESQAELDAWLAKHIAKGTFGLPDRAEMVLDETTGEMIESGVILPAEYSIVREDISAQLAQAEVNKEATKFLADSDWKILRHIREKALNQPTSLSDAEYLALEQQRAEAAASIVR